MEHCGNRAVHGSHNDCPGTTPQALTQNIVMSTQRACAIFLTAVLIRRWFQQHML